MAGRRSTGKISNEISRRDFLKITGGSALAGAFASSPFHSFPHQTKRKQKLLRILQWKHPISGYDKWFDGLACGWGENNNTKVIVKHASPQEIRRLTQGEVLAGKGHDLTMFASPPPEYEEYVIDHKDVYQDAERRHGQKAPIAHQSTFNPATKKYFAFSDCYMPAVSNWLVSPWVDIGLPSGPNDYATLKLGAKQILKQFGIPCGLGLADDLETSVCLRGLLWSFGGSVQDAHGKIVINSRETIAALEYMRALYRECETPDVFRPGAGGNILSGKTSFAVSAIFLTRSIEGSRPETARRVNVSPTLSGPVYWLACPHVTSCYVVWNFAENKEGAQQFLVDLINNYNAAFKASELCNLPSFPSTVPNLLGLLNQDPHAIPPYKYLALEDSLHWIRNIGYPGYTSAAVTDAFNSFVLQRMFRRVALGKQSARVSAAAAEAELKQIFEKWNLRGST